MEVDILSLHCRIAQILIEVRRIKAWTIGLRYFCLVVVKCHIRTARLRIATRTGRMWPKSWAIRCYVGISNMAEQRKPKGGSESGLGKIMGSVLFFRFFPNIMIQLYLAGARNRLRAQKGPAVAENE